MGIAALLIACCVLVAGSGDEMSTQCDLPCNRTAIVCVVSKETWTATSSVVCRLENPIQIEDTTISCLEKGCGIDLSAPSIVLKGSTLRASKVLFNATKSIQVIENSLIEAQKYSETTFEANYGAPGCGGGNVGYGVGPCSVESGKRASTGGAPLFDLKRPSQYGGYGRCLNSTEITPGGGTISLYADSITVSGVLKADGFNSKSTRDSCGGGAGGGILLSCSKLSMSTAELSADGGIGNGLGGGGSGGIIFISYETKGDDAATYSAHGAGTNDTKGINTCTPRYGSNGLVLTKASVGDAAPSFDVSMKGVNEQNGNSVAFAPLGPILSELKLKANLNKVIISYSQAWIESDRTKDALVVELKDSLQFFSSVIKVVNVRIHSESIAFAAAKITSTDVQFQSRSTFDIDSTSNMNHAGHLNLSGNSITIKGSISVMEAPGEENEQTRVKITSSTFESIDSSNIQSEHIFVRCKSKCSLKGQMSAAKETLTDCTQAVTSILECGGTSLTTANQDFFIQVLGNRIEMPSGSMNAASILLCGSTLTLGGSLSAAGRGCTAEAGIGAGSSVAGELSSGAGHGGAGGSVTINKNVTIHIHGGISYGGNTSNLALQYGSGGGSADLGGKGGGIINLVGEDTIAFTDSAAIDTSGTDGQRDAVSPGGGGSGGSVLLSTANLLASNSSKVLSTGGHGGSLDDTKHVSGGGGGGIIIFHRFGPVNSIVSPILNTSGAFSKGHRGLLLPHPSCPNGTASLFCSSCTPGTFHNNNVSSHECIPCSSGFFANESGSPMCKPCSAGFYSSKEGSTACKRCRPGTASLSKSASCTLCPPGRFSKENDTTCRLCPAQTFSTTEGSASCQLCAVGTYSEAGKASCSGCTNAPGNGHYIVKDGSPCSFACDPGFLGHSCVTPWQGIVNRFHGPIVFAISVLGFCIILFLPLMLCYMKSKRLQHEMYLSDIKRAKGSRHRSGSFQSYSPFISKDTNYAYRELKAESEWGPLSQSVGTASRCLPTKHFFRIMMESNTYGIRMSSYVDPCLQQLVFTDLYGDFARQVSHRGKWSKLERVLWHFLSCLHAGLGSFIWDWVQLRHIKRVARYMSHYDYACVRDPRARALAASWRFQHSSCLSAAWIDIYMLHEEDSGRYPVGKPAVPMVLVASGNGSFSTPFQFDLGDWMMKTPSEYYGKHWFSFLATVNSYLRQLTTINATTLIPAANYVDMMQCVGIGIGRGEGMPVGGICIELAIQQGESSHSARPALIITQNTDEPVHAALARNSGAGEKQECIGGDPTIIQSVESVLTKSEGSLPCPFVEEADDTNRALSYLDTAVHVASSPFFHRARCPKIMKRTRYILFLLVLLELWTTLLLIAVTSMVDGTIFLCFMLIPPAANIISPLIGFTALAVPSVTMMRSYVLHNAASQLNAIACFVASCISLYNRRTNAILAFVPPILLIVFKLGSSNQSLTLLSGLEFGHDLTLSRVEILKDNDGSESPNLSRGIHEDW